MEKRNRIMIVALVSEIERKLGWGAGQNWSNKDFEALSELLFETTKKRLSVTTLKRIWGRAEMIANPSAATLDILAEFAGHPNWREYKKSQQATLQKSNRPFVKKRMAKWALFSLAVLGVFLIGFYGTTKNGEKGPVALMDPAEFRFGHKVISSDMPNSVIFDYNASRAHDSSKVEIQQSWDDRKRITVDKNDSIATCIYYRPGFFKSKLVVDDQIVQEKDVHITTQGWLGTLEKGSVPIYLNPNEISRQGNLGTNEQVLNKYQMDPKSMAVTSSFYYISDFSELHTNDFKASLQLKSTFKKTLGGCQEVDFYILYDGGAIGIPLAKKGCVANLNLMGFDRYIDGKKADLSAFGVDFEDFITLSCIADTEIFQVFVNDSLAYQLPTNGLKRAIKGLSLHFKGTGAFKDVVLSNSQGQLFQLD